MLPSLRRKYGSTASQPQPSAPARPVVVVARNAADVAHGVDRTGTASTLPRGHQRDAPVELRFRRGVVIPVHALLADHLARPAGMWMKGCQSRGPASSSRTLRAGSAESRLASTQPAEPAPMMMVSNTSVTESPDRPTLCRANRAIALDSIRPGSRSRSRRPGRRPRRRVAWFETVCSAFGFDKPSSPRTGEMDIPCLALAASLGFGYLAGT